MRRAGCPHPAARQTKAPAINGGLRAGRPTRNPAAVRPLMRAGRGSEFRPARGIPKRNTIQRLVFLYFSRSAQQNRRGSNSLPGIPRMAEPFAGALPLPLDLTRFALVEAASSTLPAAFQKEKPPKGWFFSVITLRFCCSHPRISQGRGSVRGKPLRVSPLAFNHPPAGDRFCAAKSPLQKEKPPKGWFFFLERATRLELATSTLARSRSTR